MSLSTIRTMSGFLPIALFSTSAWAAQGGCAKVANGNYQIGQTAEIIAWSDMPPGTVVRDEKARGDGNILASCVEGDAIFEGDYTVARQDELVPLTVNGEDSGFGIEVFIDELRDGSHHAFPHRYTMAMAQGESVRSNEADVGYKVVRMRGPIIFGHIDVQTIAQQWSYLPGGVMRTEPFRHLRIYDLTLVRPACSISADTINQTVDVGTYHVGNFATPERATPWVPFQLTVDECAEPVGLIARFTFGSSVDADADLNDVFSMPAGGPANVGLEIADDYKRTIRPGEAVRMNALGTGKQFDFNVRLRETKPTVRGGSFRRPVTVIAEFR